MTTRNYRNKETRAAKERGASIFDADYGPRPDSYVRPSQLDAPDPEPGMVYRWCRGSLLGEVKLDHWHKRIKEGWRPVDTAKIYGAFPGHTGVVEEGGLILCENEKSFMDQRRALVDNDTDQQSEAVQYAVLNESTPSVPFHVREARDEQTVGKQTLNYVARQPRVADNRD